jgi:uncharacterized protein YbgA (DUF1722 family)
MVVTKTARDITDDMKRYAHSRVVDLEGADLCGFVLKRDSPSCGLYDVRVFGESESPTRDGRGLFARELTTSMPALPVEEEGRLGDPALRGNFLERVFAFRRLRDLFEAGPHPRDLVAFHSAHKLQLMSHSPEAFGELGHMVEGAGVPRNEIEGDYTAGFMNALSIPATPAEHSKVLTQCMDYFGEQEDSRVRAEITRSIEDYRVGLAPLTVPLTAIRGLAMAYCVEDLASQSYIEPYPRELMLDD